MLVCRRLLRRGLKTVDVRLENWRRQSAEGRREGCVMSVPKGGWNDRSVVVVPGTC